jgi:hypothetical protein
MNLRRSNLFLGTETAEFFRNAEGKVVYVGRSTETEDRYESFYFDEDGNEVTDADFIKEMDEAEAEAGQ